MVDKDDIKNISDDGRCPWCRGKMVDTFGKSAEEKKNGNKIYKGFSLVMPQEDNSMIVKHSNCKHYVHFPDGIEELKPDVGRKYAVEKVQPHAQSE